MAPKTLTVCRHGHPMEDPNLIYHVRNGKKIRECRECCNARTRDARKAKRRNAILERQIEAQSLVA